MPGDPLVGVAVATYAQSATLTAVLASLRAQTYPHLLVRVVHDGPADAAARMAFAHGAGGDARFAWVETPERAGRFGHEHRAGAFAALAAAGCRYLAAANGDGFFCPPYLEAMLAALAAGRAELAACNLVHSHARGGRTYQPMPTSPRRGHVDVTNWVAAAPLVTGTPWEDFGFAGDWAFFSAMHRKAGGCVAVPEYLVVHS